MSPLAVRRYRAERLLRRDFEALRGGVLGSVRARLAARKVLLDPADLDACYAQAWQGLYMATLDGEQISNASGWLVVVTFRRAIDEHRARLRDRPHERDEAARKLQAEQAREEDLLATLDDRVQLRHLFEALRGRLSAREREAAVLCYLQGLSRAEAAARMGISEARMRKLMDGRGHARPGVAGKVGRLLETIRADRWCEEQGSTMRGLAYGVLDPEGERYRLAVAHRRQCPACRAYVLSLRGLAAALPPLPALVHLAGVASTLAGGRSAGGALARSGAGGAPGALSPSAPALGTTLSGAAGAGAGAGGGWIVVAGPIGAKVAIGCLLALGVGAGCVALGPGPPRAGSAHARHAHARAPSFVAAASAVASTPSGGRVAARRLGGPARAAALASVSALGAAGREFGPEQQLAAGAVAATTVRAHARRPPPAHAAALALEVASPVSASDRAIAYAARQPRAAQQSYTPTAAEREFSPG
ncbi:MAG: hypothetical protein QOI03_1680 [Solirubrobacteraceae bacterium]|jgi:RNA polymerase sigma factor (sigma-70 family)|nr:hypothetical protein [Solirubrobacteraceae bacterium]